MSVELESASTSSYNIATDGNVTNITTAFSVPEAGKKKSYRVVVEFSSNELIMSRIGVAFYPDYEDGSLAEEVSNVVNIGFDNFLKYSSDNTAVSGYYDGVNALYCIIPDTVTAIAESAFENCTSLKHILIGNGVSVIGNKIFSGCTSLISITVSPENAVYRSEQNCIIDTAENSLIVGCEGSSVPETVTEIGDYAFYGCSGLTEIYLPDSVECIGSYAFYRCYSLAYVSIDASIAAIGRFTFYHCSSLTSVIIPDSVTTIKAFAFEYCTSLTSVCIGSGVTSVEDYAFYGCNSLAAVYYAGTSDEWSSIKFGGLLNGLTSVKRYYYYENENDVPTDGGNYWHYGEDGSIVIR